MAGGSVRPWVSTWLAGLHGNPGIAAWLDRVAGGIFVLLGAKLIAQFKQWCRAREYYHIVTCADNSASTADSVAASAASSSRRASPQSIT